MLQEIGFGMTREVVSEIVMDYITTMRRPNPFNQRPGDKWWSGFLKRHPQLVQRKPQHLSKHRAIAGNHATIDAFFSKVRSMFESLKISDAEDLSDRLGIVMRVVSALLLHQPMFLHEEVENGYTKPQEVVVEK